MQFSHLRTLLAIYSTGSFSAAGDKVYLSHSAVSVQIKQLEENAKASLFYRSSRPARFTPLGLKYVEYAQKIIDQVDKLAKLTDADNIEGEIIIGFVPTTLQTLLPLILAELRSKFPDLQVSMRSGLSADLANDVEAQAIDFAFLTAPILPEVNTALHPIADEPLFVISNKIPITTVSDIDILKTQPYIAFSRATLLGQQIERDLWERGLVMKPEIELDSVDAIENLVALGLGVSIVPQRHFARNLSETVYCIPYNGTARIRRLVLASNRQSNRLTLLNNIKSILSETN